MSSSIARHSLTYADFEFTNEWVLDLNGPKNEDGIPEYIIDKTTGRRYWNVNDERISKDGCDLASSCFIPNVFLSALFATIRAAKLATCYHFWPCIQEKKEVVAKSIREVPSFVRPVYIAEPNGLGLQPIPEGIEVEEVYWESRTQIVDLTLKDRFVHAGSDLVKLVATPISLLAMEFFACHSWCKPSNNGRKLYMVFEEIQYNGNNFGAFSDSDNQKDMPANDRRLRPEQMKML